MTLDQRDARKPRDDGRAAVASEPQSFALELEAVPGRHWAPPVVRLRRALKAFLRAYGLRCTSVRPVTPAKEIEP